MLDPFPVLCLILLLWLVVRDLNSKRFRSEPPLLPQHQNNVHYTVPLYSAEQQSVSEHEHQREALPPKAQYVHLEHEQVTSTRPLQTIQVSALSVSQERTETPLQAPPQQINEPRQSPVLVPQLVVSPTNLGGQSTIGLPQRGAVQIHQVTGTPLVPNVGGEALQLPQDDLNGVSGDYVKLRELAKEEVAAIQKYRGEKKEAKASGQLMLVQQLAQEIKKHRKRRQLFDEQASALIFTKNNKKRSLDKVDLHGLTAKEAKTRVKAVINDAREKGITEIRFIVGKGLHSTGPPTLKPAVLKLMQKLKLPANVDPSNEGILVVQLSASNASSPAVSQGQDQMLLQFSLPQASQPEQGPVLLPEIDFPSMEPDQQADGAPHCPVEDCQAMSTPDAGEELSQFLQEPINNNVEIESDDFVMIRERAKEERKLMLSYRKEKKLAKACGQLKLAQELADRENEHEARSEFLNTRASELIFARNNQSNRLDTVVLLDLKPKEAKNFAKSVIQVARDKGITQLRMVVGQGSYLQDGVQPIKPVLLKFLSKQRGLPVQVDPTNKGVLIVQIHPDCDI